VVDLPIVAVVDAADVEVRYVAAQGEELVYERLHVVLGLQPSVAAGVDVSHVQDGAHPVHLVHDLGDFVEGPELPQLAHGLDAEDHVLHPLVVQDVLALLHPRDDVGQRGLRGLPVGGGMDYDDVRPKVVRSLRGVGDPRDALLLGLGVVGVEAHEVRGVAAEPDVQLLRLPPDLLGPLGLDPGPADELHLQGVQAELPGVFQ